MPKTMCAAYVTLHRSSDEHKKELKENFDRHVLEKEKSRELKSAAKVKSIH